MIFPPRRTSTEPPRVVVTGAGIVTSLGLGWQANEEGFRTGRSSFRGITGFDVSGQRVKTGAEVDLPQTLPRTRLSARSTSRLGRGARLLLLAAHEAWHQSGWSSAGELPVVLGTTGGAMALGEEYYRHAMERPNTQRQQASRVVHYQPQRQGLDLCEAFGTEGPVTIISNACASGANAIGHAWELLRSGRADRVLTGGYDALCALIFGGFDSLQALSPTVCRPFDADRDGLALGEGAAVLALETEHRARDRGAEILGEVIGYGATTDIHHLTQPSPTGVAARAAMERACASALVGPAQVDYINAHGTGTLLNDGAEAAAINQWAGSCVRGRWVSSTKGSVGHLLGAAGAVEAVICLMVLRGQWLPPESSLERVDPACEFPLVRQPMDARVEVALTNSFGFGGANATLLLRRWR